MWKHCSNNYHFTFEKYYWKICDESGVQVFLCSSKMKCLRSEFVSYFHFKSVSNGKSCQSSNCANYKYRVFALK